MQTRASCASCPCDAIYGRASDWDVISDDLARNIYQHNLMCETMRGRGGVREYNYSL
ncbi:MAG: hypothetical protein J6T57_01120 [Alphaproteobacteria bacterium]|nr:hypothetical protein [Alphaproteobacteria bacterium]